MLDDANLSQHVSAQTLTFLDGLCSFLDQQGVMTL